MSAAHPGPTPEASIVIIVFDDEHRIEVAIRSALGQNLDAVEVIVVDHGSTDATTEVVRRFARSDPRLRLLELGDNEGGPGRPLNAGIDAARAPYVTLMGSDDEIDRDACRAMVAAAEVHDADVVMGRTDRVFVDEGRRVGSWFHAIYRQGRRVHDSITERPGLMWDTISAAKLYRRSFLDRHAIRLPEDLIYEDQLFTAEVLLKANRIVVLPQTVYRWNVHGRTRNHRPSLTNTRGSLQNLHDRIEVNRRIDDLYISSGAFDLLSAKQQKFFSHDLFLYLRDLGERDEEYRAAFAGAVRDYVGSIPLERLATLRQPLRALAFALRHGDLEAARQAFEMHRNDGRLVPLLERAGDRICFAARLADAEPEADAFLDVTEIWKPGPGLRNLHTDAHVSAGGGDAIRLTGVLHDPLDLLQAELGEPVLEVRRRQTPRVSTRVVCEVQRTGRVVRWTAVLQAGDIPRVLTDRQTWDFWLVIRRPRHRPSRVRVYAEQRNLDAAYLRTSFPVSALFGRSLAAYSTTKGNLSLRLEDRPTAGASATAIFRPMVRMARTLRSNLRRARRFVDHRLAPLSYRLALLLPVRDELVVFESFEGRSYSGSPRAISEALRRSRPDLQQVWICTTRAVARTVPAGVAVAGRESLRGSYLIGRARYWVDNFGFPAWYGKPDRTYYVQTWHGTPVKLMMLDALKVVRADPQRRAGLEALTGRWDLLLSPGSYFNDTFVRSANTKARILTVGTPRVDELITGAAEPPPLVRDRLGLPDARHVVLYAPTYRPGNQREPDLDLDLLLAQLGTGTLFLVRRHYFRKRLRVPSRLRGQVVDVSSHPDINDLMLASDVLVTDYSSVMFDYAVLERPVVIYAPDLERYERDVGTYLDLRRDGPGPLVRSTEELADALRLAVEDPAASHEQVVRFRKTYGEAERGTASDAVLEEVWGAPTRDRSEP